jgi:inosose dehydratase
MIERRAEVERLLADSEVALCLDTGHLMLGGTDPVELARGVPERVRHVHLKDVDGAVAKQAAEGGVGYAEAVRAGLYRPLGHGDLEVAAVVEALEGAGYDGWYVLEQDITLEREPPPGAGPIEDVRASLDTLRSLADRVG